MKHFLGTAVFLTLVAPSAQAAPILYSLAGTFQAGIGDVNHTLYVENFFDFRNASLVYASGALTSPDVTLIDNGGGNYSFAYTTLFDDTDGTFRVRDTVDAVGGPGTPQQNISGPDCMDLSFAPPAAFNFTTFAGGTTPTNGWTLNLTGLAVYVPELDGAAATLPVFSAMLLLGLGKKRRG